MAGAGAVELAQAGWLIALQLWFLPVYLLLIALTPVMLAAHRRWGLAVPAVLAAGAAAVDAGVVGARLPVIGYANYLLVWGSMYQWGFATRDRRLRSRGRLPVVSLAVYACGLLLTLLFGSAAPGSGRRPGRPDAFPWRAGPGPPEPAVTAHGPVRQL